MGLTQRVLIDVSSVLIISTNFITDAGLKKWRPPNLSFLETDSARSLIGSEDVFEANMQ